MKDRGLLGAPSARCFVATATILTALAIFVTPQSFAQQPSPQPKAPKQQLKQPGQRVPTESRTAPDPTAQDQPPIVYSPWSKVCGKATNLPDDKEACATIREARLQTGQFVAGAALIEQHGEQKKVLRVTLPLGLQVKAGTRVLIDNTRAMQEPYLVCLPNGCTSDFEIGPDLMSVLKQSQTLLLQGINFQGQLVSFSLPLADFAKVNEGPPTEPRR